MCGPNKCVLLCGDENWLYVNWFIELIMFTNDSFMFGYIYEKLNWIINFSVKNHV